MVAGAAAQTRHSDKSTWLPVWNNASGKLEAYLVLEPTEAPQVGTRWRFGNNSLDTTFGLEAGDSLALLCNRKSGIVGALGNLPNNCLLAALGDSLDDDNRNGSRRASATAAFSRDGGKLGVSAGSGHDTLPGWLVPGAPRNQVDVNDLTVFAQKNLRNEGFVSIAGTVAKARLVPASQAPELTDRWSSKSLTIGGGFGAFGANIVGHVIDTPGQPKWSGLGLGLTWRTPWSGQLTVGADNVVTRGKNPFSTSGNGDSGDGTVPYVRYEQDL
ncbi:hypothetical protein MQC88_07210 [Luteimonas sp. 50]|uniref:Uncharacterized protein n=1 Tax=Cognatiluteimonas sedimenti TaxID=2927791 RepID=A0ABT0A466_9GAMM|nr:hypothetical protein [Lysobacter sedimenti]MCJ0825743.1 hypothetical protein [Lysobacter sedimenti]